jgi:uncharacterized membrane protein YhaH (DUF805 family)
MDFASIDWKRLLTSFQGRIDRVQFWIGFVVCLAIGLVLGFIGSLFSGIPFVGWLVALVVGLISLYPACAVAIKRMHDRDKPDFWLAVYFGPTVLTLLVAVFGISFLNSILSLASLAAFLYMAYDLGWLEGNPGPNAHGPAPEKMKIAKAA